MTAQLSAFPDSVGQGSDAMRRRRDARELWRLVQIVADEGDEATDDPRVWWDALESASRLALSLGCTRTLAALMLLATPEEEEDGSESLTCELTTAAREECGRIEREGVE